MSNLTKFQINAVKSMSRAIQPLQRKLDRIHDKEVAFLAIIKAEKEELELQINNANASILLYTGGLTAEEVLNPASAVSEIAPEGVVDENEVADLTKIIPTTMEEVIKEVVLYEDAITGVEAIEEIPEVTASVKEVPFWDKTEANNN